MSQSSLSLRPHAWVRRRQRKSWRIFGASISAPTCATWRSQTYNCWSKSVLDRLEAAKIECLHGRDRTSTPFAAGTRNPESAACAADELDIPGWRQHEVQSTTRVPARRPAVGRTDRIWRRRASRGGRGRYDVSEAEGDQPGGALYPRWIYRYDGAPGGRTIAGQARPEHHRREPRGCVGTDRR
ncbi:hypothetical protein D3C73_1113790 [compost metagenome]